MFTMDFSSLGSVGLKLTPSTPFPRQDGLTGSFRTDFLVIFGVHGLVGLCKAIKALCCKFMFLQPSYNGMEIE